MQPPPVRAPPGTVVPDVWTFTPVAASYTVLGRALWASTQRGFPFAPPSALREIEWCDHDYPRWGEHTLCNGHLECPPVLGSPASIIGSERPPYVRGSGLFVF